MLLQLQGSCSSTVHVTRTILPALFSLAVFRVMADALGGDIDSETYELSYIAGASEVSEALESASDDLGAVTVTRTLSGI